MPVYLKVVLCILLLMLLLRPCNAQFNDESPSSSTAFFFEVRGYVALYSLNIDHIVFEKGMNKVSARVGYSYYEGSLMPLGVSYLRGSGDNYLELGAGYVPYFFREETKMVNSAFTCFRAAYRYQSEAGGLFFIFGPVYSNSKILNNDNIPWGALSLSFAIGYTLRPRFTAP